MTEPMSPEKLRDLISALGPVEHPVDKELRELASEQARRAREREPHRLTDAQVVRWEARLGELIEIERMRTASCVQTQSDILSEAMGEVIAELQGEFDARLAKAVAELKEQIAIMRGEVQGRMHAMTSQVERMAAKLEDADSGHGGGRPGRSLKVIAP